MTRENKFLLFFYYLAKRSFLFMDEWLFYYVLYKLFTQRYNKMTVAVLLYGLSCIYTSYSNIDMLETQLTGIQQYIWINNFPIFRRIMYLMSRWSPVWALIHGVDSVVPPLIITTNPVIESSGNLTGVLMNNSESLTETKPQIDSSTETEPNPVQVEPTNQPTELNPVQVEPTTDPCVNEDPI